MRFDWVAVQTSLSSQIMSFFPGHLKNASTGEEVCLNYVRKIWNNSAKPVFSPHLFNYHRSNETTVHY